VVLHDGPETKSDLTANLNKTDVGQFGFNFWSRSITGIFS